MEHVISNISCETAYVERWKMILVVTIILLISLLLYYPVKDFYLMYIKGFPPGPISLPLIGSLHLMSPSTPHLSVGKLYKRYGSIVSLRMGPFGRAVFISDLQLIDEIFRKTDISDRPKLPFIDIINNGADGIGSCRCGSEKWKYLVRVLQQGQARFSNDILYEQTRPYMDKLMKRFAEKGHNGYYPRKDIVKTCSAVFSSIVYGIKTESLESADLKSRMAYHKTVMSCLNPSHLINILPSIWLIPSSLKARVKACIQHRESQMAEQLHGHIEQFDNTFKDMMDIVAQCVTQYPSVMKDNEATTKDLLISIWTYYLAGCDTTVNTMLWILVYMSTNPDIQRHVQQELDMVFTDTNEAILEKKSSLHYTRATILECLRLSSTVAMGIPRSSATDVTLGGYFIPKDTLVMLTQWTIHHDETYWPEPFKLKPERFLHSDGSLLSLNYIFKKMPYIPFSRGMRYCLGQYIALDILLMFLCNTLRQYDIKLTDNKQPDLNGKAVLNIQPTAVPFIFQKRKAKDESENELH